jgi:hypothetical protein
VKTGASVGVLARAVVLGCSLYQRSHAEARSEWKKQTYDLKQGTYGPNPGSKKTSQRTFDGASLQWPERPRKEWEWMGKGFGQLDSSWHMHKGHC